MQKNSLSSEEENLFKKKISRLEKIGMVFSLILGSGYICIFTPIINI